MHHVDFQVLSWIMSHNLWLINYSSITVMFNSTLVTVFLLMKFPGWQCDTKFLGWHQILGWHRDTNAWIRWQNSQNSVTKTAKMTVWHRILGWNQCLNWVTKQPKFGCRICHQNYFTNIFLYQKWRNDHWKTDVVFQTTWRSILIAFEFLFQK